MSGAAGEVTRHTRYIDLPEYLTVQEAATFLGQNAWTIYQLVHRGRIPYRRFGKAIHIPREAFSPEHAKPQVTA